MEIGFDVIGDLFLSPDDEFNWEGKPTSLYCIVTGNISSDMDKLEQTLTHLSSCYKGIFFVSGQLEFENCHDIRDRTIHINLICKKINNVASLWHHVVLLESIAIIGCNGHINYETYPDRHNTSDVHLEDVHYLKRSIQKLQTHGEVKSIVVVSNSVPKKELYFGQTPEIEQDKINLDICLQNDTENKITHWIFGNCEKVVDFTIDRINYVNNPSVRGQPYWAKRIKTYI